MKKYQLCGLGNAIVDIFLEVYDDDFQRLGFERGTMRLVDLAEQKALLDRLSKTRAAARQRRLGRQLDHRLLAARRTAGFIGCVGDDRYGLFYTGEFAELGIDIGSPVIVNRATGTCVCVITPDAERTMRTCLAVSSHLAAKHVDEERSRTATGCSSRVTSSPIPRPAKRRSGKRFASPSSQQRHRSHVLRCLHPQRLRRCLQRSVERRRPALRQRSRACSLTKTKTAEEAFKHLKGAIPSAVVTNGPHGVYIRHAQVERTSPPSPVSRRI